MGKLHLGVTTWRAMRKMRWPLLWIGSNPWNSYQTCPILHWWSSNYERWFRIVGEVAECLCSNGVKMLIRTRPDILCTINVLVRVVTKWNRACAKPLPRLKSFLQMHFGTSTILSCWRQSQWMQARSVPRPPCCWIIRRFKVNIWCNGLYIWWSYICTNVRNKR